IAAHLKGSEIDGLRRNIKSPLTISLFPAKEVEEVDVTLINYPWDLILRNSVQIELDFEDNLKGQIEGKIYDGAVLLNQDNVHVGEGTEIKPGAVLDAENGPIFIGKNVKVFSNAVIEGPVYIGDGSMIKVCARIYEGTSIGEVCKVGGEVEESIIHSYSNKQHDGFIGHSYIGKWVNIGADTNNSDLKNNYASVKVPINGDPVDSGSIFVGLIMGDHTKTGINTMFNTGTVVGVSCNIYGGGFPPKFIPSFSWGGSGGFQEYLFDKAVETAKRVMQRRKLILSQDERDMLKEVFQFTSLLRNDFLEKFSRRT
ncbi:MAG: hypothetical protein ACE5QV_08590, partial [Fidelibacterota bacterium]